MIIFHINYFKNFPNVKNMFIIFITNCKISKYIIKFIFVGQAFSELFKPFSLVIGEKNPFFFGKSNTLGLNS